MILEVLCVVASCTPYTNHLPGKMLISTRLLTVLHSDSMRAASHGSITPHIDPPSILREGFFCNNDSACRNFGKHGHIYVAISKPRCSYGYPYWTALSSV